MKTVASVARPFSAGLFVLAMLTAAAQAQSGRCLMHGFVVGARDNPGLKDATVTLLGDPDNDRLRKVKLTAKIDDKGKYELKDIPYGDYMLRVSAPGYVTYQINIYMLSDTTTQLHIKLRKEKSRDKETK